MSHRWIELLQRRRAEHRGTDRVLNIAHRGARTFAPDNTIAAIDKAALAVGDRPGDRLATAVLTEGRFYQRMDELTQVGADALHPGRYVQDRGTVHTIRAGGRRVNVWTQNDPDRMRTLIEAGGTGIITD